MRTTLRTFVLAAVMAAGLAGPVSAARLTVAQGFDPQSLWPNATTNAETYNVGTPDR